MTCRTDVLTQVLRAARVKRLQRVLNAPTHAIATGHARRGWPEGEQDMPFEPVRIVHRETGTTGIKAACSNGDRPQDRIVTISLNRDAQVRHFGRQIDTANDRFNVQRGTETDKGKVRIRLNPEGDIPPIRRLHGSVLFRFKAFPPVPPEKVKGTTCAVLESDRAQAQVIIRLPWRDGSAG